MANAKRKIVVDTASRMAYLSKTGLVQVFNGRAWSRASGEPSGGFVDVAIGPSGLWAVTPGGAVYRYDADNRRWRKDSKASKVESVSTDALGNLWLVNDRGEVYKKESTAQVSLSRDWSVAPKPR